MTNTTGNPVAFAPQPAGSFEEDYLTFTQGSLSNYLEFLEFAAGNNASLYSYTPSPLLFTGPSSAPTLLAGVIPNESYNYDSASLVLTGPLTITDVSSASPVPGPSSLALLGTGLIGIVAAARRRLS